jgi:hypothetical protein
MADVVSTTNLSTVSPAAKFQIGTAWPESVAIAS